MGRIVKSTVDLIGKTPLVKLSNISEDEGLENNLIAKVEFFNPGGSVKDRIAYGMIRDAEERGIIDKDTLIIEPTSGNTGIGLALVCASLGYKLTIIMPDTMSHERRSLIKAYGAELILTPGSGGMNAAIAKAKELKEKNPNSFIPQQFENKVNPRTHRETTAREIWEDSEGKIDIFVGGVGTGGTITGVGEALKELNSDIKIVAIEPFDSPVMSGGMPGPHGIQGIGAGFIPDVLNLDIIDEIVKVKTEEAIEASKTLAKREGLLVGISSGAALFGALTIAKRPENKGKTIVVLLPDTGERYLSSPLLFPREE